MNVKKLTFAFASIFILAGIAGPAQSSQVAAKTYVSCADVLKKYPNGVAINTKAGNKAIKGGFTRPKVSKGLYKKNSKRLDKNNNGIICEQKNVLEITANPHSDVLGMKFFTKYVDVFGLGIYAEAGLSDAQVLHAAAILAELLDNDENGVIDDEALLARLVDQRAIIPMFNGADYQPGESPAKEDLSDNGGQLPFRFAAILYEREVDPWQPGHWGSDASVEEIMHTINKVGHVFIYPDAFSFEPGSSLLTEAMDEARGGRFLSVPKRYPKKSWYHYDDKTCSYSCMAAEYIYWAQVSNMEILNDSDTCSGIANEWEPCSQALLKKMDPLIYALITNPEYKLPQNAPNGIYKPTVG